MHDGVEIEKRGVPSVTVCTEPFHFNVRMSLKLAGLPGYPCIMMPHPLATLSADEVRGRSLAALPHVTSVLLEGRLAQ